MKRWIFGLLVFSIAFSIGLLSSSFSVGRRVEITRCFVPIGDQVSLSPEQAEQFVPEFFNLPEWSEIIDFDDETLDGKLIDMSDGPEGSVFRRSEVVAKNGEEWLVLTRTTSGEYSLSESRAKVRKLNTISWPGDEKDAKLRFDIPGKPILAFRNIRGISSGAVSTLFLHTSRIGPDEIIQSEDMSNGYRRDFILNGSTYTLRTSFALSKDGDQLGVLVLESEGSAQILDQVKHSTGDRDIIGTLLWAGDLDRDGKLDLYFDRFNEIGAFSSRLFLSSHAKNGNLLDIVAVFGTAGC